MRLSCMVQIHAISIQLHLLQTKDTESHEDSDFCYDWGVRMCEFCKNIGIGIPDWDFLTPDENGRTTSGDAIEIRKIVDKHALVFTNSADEYDAGALNIAFCPMCGRKLV